MTSAVPPPTTPAGWHPDPNAPGTQRYWDGAQWTDHVAPAAPAGDSSGGALVTVGLVLAFLFPLAGLVIGFVVLTKKGSTGLAIILLSILASVAWWYYLGLGN